jgi:hypothetical protein
MEKFLSGDPKGKKTRNGEKYYFEFKEQFWNKPRK